MKTLGQQAYEAAGELTRAMHTGCNLRPWEDLAKDVQDAWEEVAAQDFAAQNQNLS